MDLSIVGHNITESRAFGLITPNAEKALRDLIVDPGFLALSEAIQKDQLRRLCDDLHHRNEFSVVREKIPGDEILFSLKRKSWLIRLLVDISGNTEKDIENLVASWGNWDKDRRYFDLSKRLWEDFIASFSGVGGYFIGEQFVVWLARPRSSFTAEPWGDISVSCLPRLLGLAGRFAGTQYFALKCKAEGDERRPTVLEGDFDYWRANGRTCPRTDVDAECRECNTIASCRDKCPDGFPEVVRKGLLHSMIYPSPLTMTSLAEIFTLCEPR